MPIRVHLKKELKSRNLKLICLSESVGVTLSNLSRLNCNKAKLIRFELLDNLCKELSCKPGDILKYEE